MSDSKLEPKIVFRAIGPEHRELIEEGFARLSPDARYLRFFGAKHRLTPGELRYLSEPDGDDHFALGAAWLHPSGMLEGLGVARYVRSPDDPKLAHVAVTVLDEAQGRGVLGLAQGHRLRHLVGEDGGTGEESGLDLLLALGTILQLLADSTIVFRLAGENRQFDAVIACLLTAAALAIAWPRALADPPHREVPGAEGSLATAPRPGLLAAGATVWLTGIICLIVMTPEGAILDWSALYLRQELGADPALSGLAFGAFSAAMALMRFLGDLVRDRFGAVRTFRVSAVLAMIGLTMAGLAQSPQMAILGFAIAGLGFANTVPIAFSAAGNLPGLPQGLAISVVTFMGYSGILFAPSVIGFIAEHTGFAAIYLALPVFVIMPLVFSGLMRHADRQKA